ncbi:hypothetical protein B8V81_2811 [Paenibacillus pasadenensis]|uniref:Uncharacterized protein n=1 Tax=Paenibacillus pasadenensis TaxID=217090 RepID=A0A2N5N214_9BACL|nr:hypothetical protein B8V81_2811 [Paenibacillus pasadenensis]
MSEPLRPFGTLPDQLIHALAPPHVRYSPSLAMNCDKL